MQFFSGIVLNIDKNPGEKFEDMFLGKIASKGSSSSADYVLRSGRIILHNLEYKSQLRKRRLLPVRPKYEICQKDPTSPFRGIKFKFTGFHEISMSKPIHVCFMSISFPCKKENVNILHFDITK